MLALIATALQVGGSIVKGVSATRAAAANRRAQDRLAGEVIERGEEEVAQYERGLNQLLGRQRVAGAAQGIDINQGSMATIREQTEAAGAMDIAAIRENAKREAWGIRTQAKLNEQAVKNQVIGSAIATGGTLMTMGVDPWKEYMAGRRARAATVPTRVPTRMQGTMNIPTGAV